LPFVCNWHAICPFLHFQEYDTSEDEKEGTGGSERKPISGRGEFPGYFKASGLTETEAQRIIQAASSKDAVEILKVILGVQRK
jgi:hypothetical protein